MVRYLRPMRSNSVFADVTLGEGGHAIAMLDRYRDVNLVGSDADAELLARCRHRLDSYIGRFQLLQAWSDEALAVHEPGTVDLILMDLGICRFHFENSARGFSFMRDEPLDMRFNQTEGFPAVDLVNGCSEKELHDLLVRYGGDRNASSNAAAIIRARTRQPIKTTYQLARAIIARSPWRGGRRHPATQVFQALRIAVNDESDRLGRALDVASRVLRIGGRLAVIAFQSIDDGIVKRFPTLNSDLRALTRRPEVPGVEEVKSNPAARSARLRVMERLT